MSLYVTLKSLVNYFFFLVWLEKIGPEVEETNGGCPAGLEKRFG